MEEKGFAEAEKLLELEKVPEPEADSGGTSQVQSRSVLFVTDGDLRQAAAAPAEWTRGAAECLEPVGGKAQLSVAARGRERSEAGLHYRMGFLVTRAQVYVVAACHDVRHGPAFKVVGGPEPPQRCERIGCPDPVEASLGSLERGKKGDLPEPLRRLSSRWINQGDPQQLLWFFLGFKTGERPPSECPVDLVKFGEDAVKRGAFTTDVAAMIFVRRDRWYGGVVHMKPPPSPTVS